MAAIKLANTMPALVIVACAALGRGAAAQAQDVSHAAPDTAGQMQSVVPPAPPPPPVVLKQSRPLFHVFGMPVRLGAPVAPPYGNAAYRNLGGQPETGRDVILEQGMYGGTAADQVNNPRP